MKRLSLALVALAVALASSTADATLVVVPFDTPGAAAAQTAPVGISLFASNSFTTTQGISGLFTGNATAPIGPPSALSLGSSPGAATYFHFAPLPGYQINFVTFGIVYLIAALLWLRIDATEPVVPDTGLPADDHPPAAADEHIKAPDDQVKRMDGGH